VRNVAQRGGPGPMDQPLLTLTLNWLINEQSPLRHSATIGWPEGKGHSAQHTLTIGIYRGFTLRLSNLSSAYPRRAGVTLRRRDYILSHLREPGGLLFASDPKLSSTLSPGLRLSSPCTAGCTRLPVLGA